MQGRVDMLVMKCDEVMFLFHFHDAIQVGLCVNFSPYVLISEFITNIVDRWSSGFI